MIQIRKATYEDYNAIWEIFSEVIKSGATYVFPADTPKSDLKTLWLAPTMETYVAETEDGEIVGTYMLRPNQIGRGSHVANAGYMVKPNLHGQGIGHLLCEHSIERAMKAGYSAMQFNMVVSTNSNAIKLWKKLGFKIIGTIPKGFQHKELGKVDSIIMWRSLDE